MPVTAPPIITERRVDARADKFPTARLLRRLCVIWARISVACWVILTVVYLIMSTQMSGLLEEGFLPWIVSIFATAWTVFASMLGATAIDFALAIEENTRQSPT